MPVRWACRAQWPDHGIKGRIKEAISGLIITCKMLQGLHFLAIPLLSLRAELRPEYFPQRGKFAGSASFLASLGLEHSRHRFKPPRRPPPCQVGAVVEHRCDSAHRVPLAPQLPDFL
jgi:hypothetical protein